VTTRFRVCSIWDNRSPSTGAAGTGGSLGRSSIRDKLGESEVEEVLEVDEGGTRETNRVRKFQPLIQGNNRKGGLKGMGKGLRERRDTNDTVQGTPFRQVRPMSQHGFATLEVRCW
jgi:hypothetical protein